MGKVTPTSKRKADHIRVNLEENVQSGLTTGLERLRFEHNAVPELNLELIDTTVDLFGRSLAAPLLISSMTGGAPRAGAINRTLAEAAQQARVAMGLGSQRAALEDPSLADTFSVRDLAPDILLFSNLGAVQLNYGYGADHCQRAVDMVGADALVLHFNPLQEALQPEGDVNFAGLLSKIEAVCSALSVPVIAKEVGWGISVDAARRLLEAGIAAIDVAGAGGTSWSQVEMHRAGSEAGMHVAAPFVDWGIPTAEAIPSLRESFPQVPLIASGGLRDGIDVAKCLALGADLGGMAGPYLKAAVESTAQVLAVIQRVARQLRVAMFGVGAKDLPALKSTPLHRIP